MLGTQVNVIAGNHSGSTGLVDRITPSGKSYDIIPDDGGEPFQVRASSVEIASTTSVPATPPRAGKTKLEEKEDNWR